MKAILEIDIYKYDDSRRPDCPLKIVEDNKNP
jgi:hypothetical protein